MTDTSHKGPRLGRCFVTGAAGFIGSHLVERLLAEGHAVTGFDNLSTGRTAWLAAAMDDARFTFVRGDLLEPDSLAEALAGHDTVFHLAANGDIRAAVDDPSVDLKQGTIATYNTLRAASRAGARTFVFTSSGSAYGMAERVPTPETIGPPRPMSMYAAAKVAGEALVSAFAHTFGLRGYVFRLGNVVGARMTRGVVYDFIEKLRRDPARLEVLGDGEQLKSYILVEEVIDAMLFALGRAAPDPCALLHLSCARAIPVREVARIVIEELGLSDVAVRYGGGSGGWPGDQPVAEFDIAKLRALGWEARRSSEEAVREAVRRLAPGAPAAAVAGGGKA